MATFKLRENEEIKMKAQQHWSQFLATGIWAFVSTPGLIMALASPRKEISPFWFLVVGYGPLLYKILSNRAKKFYITNQRLYIESGVFSKSSGDVPLNKINDILFTQSLGERLFGIGSVKVYTGNDKATSIKSIIEPENFKECLSHNCNTKVS